MKTGGFLCLIDFFNLSDKVIDSIQMNIVCFDAEEKRIGGRLVRAGAHGEPRENFSGAFAPEHVENVARVEASVEKVWYQDGVIWRREERNVREYTPNALPPGRELDRLRSVAGPDAVGCGGARGRQGLALRLRTRKPHQRRQLFVLRAGQGAHGEGIFLCGNRFDAWAQGTHAGGTDASETLRRSSEQTVEQMKAVQQKQKKRENAPAHGDPAAGACCASLLAAARWGAPYAVSLFARG